MQNSLINFEASIWSITSVFTLPPKHLYNNSPKLLQIPLQEHRATETRPSLLTLPHHKPSLSCPFAPSNFGAPMHPPRPSPPSPTFPPSSPHPNLPLPPSQSGNSPLPSPVPAPILLTGLRLRHPSSSPFFSLPFPGTPLPPCSRLASLPFPDLPISSAQSTLSPAPSFSPP